MRPKRLSSGPGTTRHDGGLVAYNPTHSKTTWNECDARKSAATRHPATNAPVTTGSSHVVSAMIRSSLVATFSNAR